eukprot:11727922-Karenia_brevis.AAC.1
MGRNREDFGAVASSLHCAVWPAAILAFPNKKLELFEKRIEQLEHDTVQIEACISGFESLVAKNDDQTHVDFDWDCQPDPTL